MPLSYCLLVTDSLLRDGDLRVMNNYQLDTPVRRALPGGRWRAAGALRHPAIQRPRGAL